MRITDLNIIYIVTRLRADHSSYGDSLPFLHELDLYHSHTTFTKLFRVFSIIYKVTFKVILIPRNKSVYDIVSITPTD